MSIRHALSGFTNAELVEFAKAKQEQARRMGREQAQNQREADAARKEIKRRKRA